MTETPEEKAERLIQWNLRTQNEMLIISNSKLRVVPEAIGNLIHLKKLYLPSNLLTALPESMSRLHQLTDLWIQDNSLTTLPE